MKHMVKIATTAVVACLMATSTAQAAPLVAGWDFSQYAGDSFLTIDGATFVDTLSANYSNFDPTGNAGAESAAFGTFYYDGQFGSSSFPVGTGTEPLLPSNPSLAGNIDGPVQGFGDNPYDSLTQLVAEGQAFANSLAMTAFQTVDVVFQADLSTLGALDADWDLELGASTFFGTSDIAVMVSSDGANYAPAGTILATTQDQPFLVDLGVVAGSEVYVKLTLDTSAGQPIIDNVGLHAAVPEPGALALLGLALLGLGSARHRARA